MKRIIALFLVTLSTNAYAYVAPFEGVEVQEVKINGKAYEIPVGNIERKQDIYFLKKALKGDADALDMFLGGSEARMFYIGKERPMWLKVTRDSMEVIKP